MRPYNNNMVNKPAPDDLVIDSDLRKSIVQKKSDVAEGGDCHKSDRPAGNTAPEAGKGSSPDLSTSNCTQCAGEQRKDCRKDPEADQKEDPKASGCDSPFQAQALRLQVRSTARPAENSEGINEQGCRSETNCARRATQSCREIRDKAPTHE
jgi:hypothetical protein